MDENSVFRQRLRKLREKQRRKQYIVSERYERGEMGPSVEALISIADYFEVSIDYLIGRTENPQINR